MSDGEIDLGAQARAKAYAMPLADINLADTELWRTDTAWPYLERLRKEDPVHWHPPHHHPDVAFWSVTRYADILAAATNHQVFSSEPSITIFDPREDFTLPMFIAMDPPKHDVQRKTVSPVVSPANLHVLEPLIRERIRTPWTGCRSESRSTGSTGSPSSSPPRCWRPYSTSPGMNCAS